MKPRFIYSFFFTLLFWVILFPGTSEAYIDPGIIGSFFQIVYFILFGVLAAIFLKPVSYLKDLMKKIKKIIKPNTGQPK